MKKDRIKEFEYSLAKDISLNILRRGDNSIIGGTLIFDDSALLYAFNNNGGTYVRDFSMSFLGYAPSKSLNEACLNELDSNSGETPGMVSGIMGMKNKSRLVCLGTLARANGFPSKSGVSIMTVNNN